MEIKNLNVLDYFYNRELEKANANQEFSDEEKIVIIMNSICSKDEKIEVLNSIKESVEGKLRDEIDDWVSSDLNKVNPKSFLNDIVVELDTPYEAFDIVEAPCFNDVYKRFIVADKNDKFVKEVMDNHIGEEKLKGYWIKLNLPCYYIEKGYSINTSRKHGEVNASMMHAYTYGAIAKIRLIDPMDITIREYSHIQAIKAWIKNNKEGKK